MVKMRYHYPQVETGMLDKTHAYLPTDMISGYDYWFLNFCYQHFNHVMLNNCKTSRFFLKVVDNEITGKYQPLTGKSHKNYISEICASFVCHGRT